MSSKKNMVLQFRVHELRSLLAEFGDRNLNLRKEELQRKALALLSRSRDKAVGKKVCSLYESMIASRRKLDSYPLSAYDSAQQHLTVRTDYSKPGGDNLNAGNEIRGTHIRFSNSENGSYSSKFERLDADGIKNVKFPDLTYYEHVSDLMPVTPVVPTSDTPIDNLFEFKSSFWLNSEAYRCLFRCDDRSAKYEAMLRLCLIDEKFEIDGHMPLKLYVTVDGKFCSCVPDDRSRKNELKQPAAPINITSFMDAKMVLHQLVVHWSVSGNEMFVVTVQLLKRKAVDELVRNLVAKGEQDPCVSKSFIRKNLTDDDNEITATSLKVSLTCPLGKMLMTYPSRGTTCNHLQCFDGALYIKMNEVKSTWQCPVCDQTCWYQNLFVDGYFMDILRSERFKPDFKDVEVNVDGSWECVASEAKKRPKTSAEVLAKRTRAEEVSDCSCDSFADELKEVYSSFANCTETRSHEPEFNFVEPPGSRSDAIPSSIQPPPTNPPVSETLPATKNVTLVDLVSDSESDDVESTRAVSNLNSAALRSSRSENVVNSYSPPVYDIDSD